jgi:branched-subunit amino acid ABC-type transport system permease component
MEHDGGQNPQVGLFFRELVNGITAGALYALVPLAFTVVYGVLTVSCSTSRTVICTWSAFTSAIS